MVCEYYDRCNLRTATYAVQEELGPVGFKSVLSDSFRNILCENGDVLIAYGQDSLYDCPYKVALDVIKRLGGLSELEKRV